MIQRASTLWAMRGVWAPIISVFKGIAVYP
jgi:hypothetical protein